MLFLDTVDMEYSSGAGNTDTQLSDQGFDRLSDLTMKFEFTLISVR